MKIDPVKERSRESALVAAPEIVTAGAGLIGQSESPAGARVHGRDEQEIGRESSLLPHALEKNLSVLERLAQGLEGLAAKLRQLIEKENAMVGPVSYTHLPSPRDLSTSRMPSSA